MVELLVKLRFRECWCIVSSTSTLVLEAARPMSYAVNLAPSRYVALAFLLDDISWFHCFLHHVLGYLQVGRLGNAGYDTLTSHILPLHRLSRFLAFRGLRSRRYLRFLPLRLRLHRSLRLLLQNAGPLSFFSFIAPFQEPKQWTTDTVLDL